MASDATMEPPQGLKAPHGEPPEADATAVKVHAVGFSWPGAQFHLDVADFRLARGASVLLVGPSGSGKSTFLSLLCGIVAPQVGSIHILDRDICTLPAAGRDRFRAEHFGIIFQMFNLLPYGRVIDNVALPLRFAPERRVRAAAGGGIEAEATRLLAKLGLDHPAVASAQAARLSVGQQQRVAAARALIGRPEIIVADEPTSALDRTSQSAFLDLLFEECRACGSSLVMVSHDEALGSRFDTVVNLDDIAKTRRGAAI